MSRLETLVVEIFCRSLRHLRLGVGVMVTTSGISLAGCGDDALDPNEVLSVAVGPADTLIFATDAVTYKAVVEYRSGPGEPDSVAWSVSDATVLALSVEPDGSATVIGIERGEGFIIAEVDGQYVDSAQAMVVQPGDVRWRVEGAGATTYSGPALDGQGRIYTVYID